MCRRPKGVESCLLILVLIESINWQNPSKNLLQKKALLRRNLPQPLPRVHMRPLHIVRRSMARNTRNKHRRIDPAIRRNATRAKAAR